MRVGASLVTASNNPKFVVGDHVTGLLGVKEFAYSNGQGLTKVDPKLAPLPLYLSTLGMPGMPGMTGYFGLLEVGQPKAGDTVVVFGAKRYTNSTKTSLLGTQVLSFAIQPETSTTALLKLIEVEQDNAGNTTTTSTITFRLTPAGAMTRLSETAVSGATALTLTYL